jgi:Cytochrome c554 and c-prime
VRVPDHTTRRPAHRSAACAIALAMIALPVSVPSSPAADLPLDRSDKVLGVSNCSSRQCHGAVCTDADAGLLFCEYRIWLQADPHSRAYRLLTEGESGRTSERIVRLAGLGSNPAEVTQCLACHGTNVSADRRGEKLHASEGVTCEACHGGASGWLESHKRRGETHAENVKNGLYPTDDVEKRAELCLSCHVGDEKRFVTHAMMAGGHPRLSFELATYTLTQPAHFRVGQDGPRSPGKSATSAATTWAVGQLVAARQYLALLASPQHNREGAWPEFTLYDCDSCHQTITNPPRPSLVAPGLGGFPRLADDSLRLAGVALQAIPGTGGAAARLRDLSAELQTVSVKQGLPATISIAAQGRTIVDGALADATGWTPTEAELRPLLAQIRAEGAKGGLTYWEAQQRYNAAQAILASLEAADPLSGTISAASSQALAGRLAPVYATVRTEEAFRPDRFRSAFASLGAGGP